MEKWRLDGSGALFLWDRPEIGEGEVSEWQLIDDIVKNGEGPKSGERVLLWLGFPWDEPRVALWFEPWNTWIEGVRPEPNVFDPYGIGEFVPTYWARIIPPWDKLATSYSQPDRKVGNEGQKD